MNGFVRHVLPAALYVAAIFYGGSIHVAIPLNEPELPTDKFLHFLAFAGLVFVAFRAVRYEFPSDTLLRQVVLAFSVSVACGALLEVYQAALPHRSAEALDLLADTLGAGLASVILLRRQERRA